MDEESCCRGQQPTISGLPQAMKASKNFSQARIWTAKVCATFEKNGNERSVLNLVVAGGLVDVWKPEVGVAMRITARVP